MSNDYGGATITITAKDLTKAGFDAAIASLKGVGLEADAARAHLAGMQTATGSLSNGMGLLKGVLGSLGIGFGVASMVSFGKHVFETAGNIQDMSTKLGISTDAVQGFKFAAEQSGSSLDAVGVAINKLNVNLAGGEKATVGALRAAGLEFKTIRAMQPEEAFLAIADAIRQIPDPMTRADVAVQLFGKGGAALLPAIMEGFRGTANAANKMSKDTIRDLEAAGDAWAALGNRVTIITGEMIARMMRLPKYDATFQDNVMKFGMERAIAFGKAAAEIAAAQLNSSKDVVLGTLPAVLHRTKEELDALEAAQKKAKAAAEAYAKAVQSLREQLSGAALQADLKKLVQAFAGLTAIQLDNVDVQMRVGKAAANFRTQGADLPPMLAVFATRYERLNALMGESIPLLTRSSAAWRDAAIAALGMGEQLPLIKDKTRLVNEAISALFLNSHSTWTLVGTEVKAVTVDFGALAQSLSQLSQISGDSFGGVVKGIATVISAMDLAQQGGKSMAGGLDAIQEGGKGAAAGMVQFASGLITAIAALETATQSTDKLKSALGGAAAGAEMGGQVGGGWGALIGAIGGGLFGFIKGSENAAAAQKKLHAELMATANGASTLAEKIKYLGWVWQGAFATDAGLQQFLSVWSTSAMAAAEASYKTIAELDTIAKKAEEVYKYMVASGLYGAAALAAAFEASKAAAIAAMSVEATAHQTALKEIAARYDDMFKAIDTEYKSLSASVAAEAEEEFMGVVETQQRARMKTLEDEKAALEKKKAAELTTAEETYAAWLEAGKTARADLEVIFGKALKIPIEWVYPDGLPGPGGRGGTVPSFDEGTGGQFVNFGAGTPAMLHGWERVMTEEEGRGGGRPLVININNRTELDGRVVAENQVRYQGRVLAPYGIR